MADLKKLLTYLIEQLPNNKLLQVCDQIQPKKTGTNDYLSCEEFLDNIWNRDELRKIFEIEDGKKEVEKKVVSEKEDSIIEDKKRDIDWKEVFKSEEIGIDCRIKKIEFEKLKYYPEKVNDYLFGTSFMDTDGNPKSALILGSNGVGKTSIYQAIEFSFRNQIGEVFLRDYDFADTKKVGGEEIENLFKEYFTNKEYLKEKEVTAFIETVGKKISIKNPLIVELKSLQKYLSNLFFISDYEIYKFGRLKFEGGDNDSFRMFMGESMDLGELLWFNRLMGKLSCYKKYAEIFDDKSEETENVNIKIQNIDSLKKEIVQLYEQIPQINKLITDLEKVELKDTAEIIKKYIFTIKNFLNPQGIGKLLKDELKNKHNEIFNFINTIKNENKKLKGKLFFEQLYDYNVTLISFLNKVVKEVNLDSANNPELIKKSTDKLRNELRLSLNDKIKEYNKMRENIINNIKTRISSNYIKELIDKVIESSKNLSSIEKNISVADKNRKEIFLKNKIIEEIKKDAEQVFNGINEIITNHFNKHIKEEVADTIKEVMTKFLVKNNEDLKWLNEDLKIVDFEPKKYPQYLSLKMNLKENGENSKIELKRYFNTFRYRMFCILLLISTSFAIMKKLKINFPIVIDDVFHANDFKNRTEIKNLIDSIIVSHKRIFKDEPKDLQLIIFTHDDLIFNSIRKCILDNNYKSKNDNINFGFYRLLHFDQAEKDDVNDLNNVLYEFN